MPESKAGISKPAQRITDGKHLIAMNILGSGAPARRFVSHYNWMIPRFRPTVTAWVLSLASSFERMLFTWPLTVSSLMDN